MKRFSSNKENQCGGERSQNVLTRKRTGGQRKAVSEGLCRCCREMVGRGRWHISWAERQCGSGKGQRWGPPDNSRPIFCSRRFEMASVSQHLWLPSRVYGGQGRWWRQFELPSPSQKELRGSSHGLHWPPPKFRSGQVVDNTKATTSMSTPMTSAEIIGVCCVQIHAADFNYVHC